MSETDNTGNRAAGQPDGRNGADEAAIIADYKEHFLEILAERIRKDEEFAEKGFRSRYDSPEYGDGSDLVDDGSVTAPQPVIPAPSKPAIMEGYPAAAPETEPGWLYEEKAGPRPRKAEAKKRTRWTVLLALAAVFVFLIGGTLLTRGKFGDTNRPYRPDEQAIPESQKTGDGGTEETDGTRMPDVSPESVSVSGAESFFSDMWLFVKAAAPYVLCFAAGAAAGGFAVRKKQEE